MTSSGCSIGRIGARRGRWFWSRGSSPTFRLLFLVVFVLGMHMFKDRDRKKRSFRKYSFFRRFINSRDSRESPECGKQERIRSFSGASRELKF